MLKKSLIFFLFLIGGLLLHGQSTATNYEDFDQKFSYADSLKNAGEHGISIQIHFGLLEYLTENQSDGNEFYTRLSKTYYNISYLYLFLNDSLSEGYAVLAINSALKTENFEQIEKSYSLKYYCLYGIPGRSEELNEIADQCIYYSELANNDKMLAEAYMHKCNALVELGRSDEGEDYCSKAENLFKQIEGDEYLSSVYGNIGNVFLKSGDYTKAIDYHLKGYELSVKTQDLESIIDGARNLAYDHELKGDLTKANFYYKLYADSLDVYYQGLLDARFTEANAKYETAEKDKEIAENQLALKQKSLTIVIVSSIGVVALVIVLLIFQTYRNKQKQKKVKLEQELLKEKEFNQMRTTFLENIAHEIRTPITLINGYLELGLESIKPGSQNEKNIQTALDHSNKVLGNVNEILELLKFEKGKLPVRKKNVTIESFMRRVFYSFQSLAEIKQIDLQYQSNCFPDTVIFTDEGRLEKILNNFISNAIKYSPSNTAIYFKADLTENKLVIKVIDSGPGIDVSEKELIFKRFYQSKNGDSIGGVGIGLSLAKEFSESLGGSVNVESEKGKGSTFMVKLPVEIVKEVAQESEKETQEHKPSTALSLQTSIEKKFKILIVEDNPEMSDFLTTILSPMFKCDTAFDGQEALQKVTNTRYDIIVSDVMMPNTDGFEFRKQLSRLEHYKSTPFVFITAKSLEEDKMYGLNLGVDDYITKPFSKDELIARLNNLLSNKKERELWIRDNLEFIGDNDGTAEEQLLQKVKQIIAENISDENFKVTKLAEDVGYSQRQLARLLKKYTGLSPVQFVLEVRLTRAYNAVMEKKFKTVSELRYHVGIPGAAYFNRKFQERFGSSPSEMMSSTE